MIAVGSEDFYGPAEPAPKDHSNYQLDPPSQEHMEDWLIRTCELIDRYRPQVLWFDWWINQRAWQKTLQKLAAYYYNRMHEWGMEGAINYKYDAFPNNSGVFDVERGQLSGIRKDLWQNDTSISNTSWGYTVNQQYKSSAEIVADLVDIVSKHGALLLNIGPRADGTIPEEEQEVLLQIGQWLRVNGEGIYDTKPWTQYGEGPTEIPEGAFTDTKRSAYTAKDIRYTQKEDAIYAFVMNWSNRGVVKLTAMENVRIKAVEIMGEGEVVWHQQDATGLTIHTIGRSDQGFPVGIKLTI